jgi:hypothetical protein
VQDPASKGLSKTQLRLGGQLGIKVAVTVAMGGYLHWEKMGGVPRDLE